MNKKFTKFLALFMALIMAVPFGAFGTLGIFAETENTETEQTEEETFTFPTLTNTETVVYFGYNTGGDNPDGTSLTSSFTTVAATAAAVKEGGTVVLASKGYVSKSCTFKTNAAVVITGKDPATGEFVFDVENPDLKNAGTGQWGMFLVAASSTFTLQSELIIQDTIILERGGTGKTSTIAVDDGGVLMIEDTVRFMMGQDSKGTPVSGPTTKLTVGEGGVAVIKAAGFSSYSGVGTIYVDKNLINNGIDPSQFGGFTGKLVDLDGNPLCSVTGNHSNAVTLINHAYYNKCSSCGEQSPFTYSEPVLSNTTDEYYWSYNTGKAEADGTTLQTPQRNATNIISTVNNGGTIYLISKGFWNTSLVFDMGGTTKYTAVLSDGTDYRGTGDGSYGAMMWEKLDQTLTWTFNDDSIFENINFINRTATTSILSIANASTALFEDVECTASSTKYSTVILNIESGSTVIMKGSNVGPFSQITGYGTLVLDINLVKAGKVNASTIENFKGTIMTLDCKEVCAFTGGHDYVDNTCSICGTVKGTAVTQIYVKKGGTGDGLTPENPTDSLRKGFQYTSADPIEIILVDDLIIDGFIRCDGNSQDITITSMDLDGDGVYPKLIVRSWVILQNSGAGNTITFENIEIQSDRTGTVPIFANYNNLTIGEGVTCTISDAHKADGLYPTIYAGFLESEGSNTAADKSNDYDTTINVASGTWSSVFGGNRRNAVENSIGNNRGNITINITGGTIVGTEGRGAITGTGYNFYSGNITINISGGNINGNIYGVGFLGQIGGATPYSEYGLKGDISVNITGGAFNGQIHAKYQYTSIAPLVRGNVSVYIGEGVETADIVVDLRGTVAYSGQNNISSLTYDEIHEEYITTKFVDSVNGTETGNGEPKRIAFIGDSITQGTGATDRTKYAYPARIQSMLDSDVYMIGNFGVGAAGALPSTGYFYNDTLQYHLLMEEFEPHIVSFALGTNDAASVGGTRGAADNFKTYYYNLIESVVKFDSVEKVIVATPLLRLDHINNATRNVSFVEPIIRDIVATLKTNYPDVDIDLFELNALTYQDVLAGNILGTDDLHPNDAGYILMAEAFYNALFNDVLDIPEGYYLDVIYVSDNGTATGAGTLEDPINNLAVALARANRTEATIYIVDTLSVHDVVINEVEKEVEVEKLNEETGETTKVIEKVTEQVTTYDSEDIVTPTDIGTLNILGYTSDAVLNWYGATIKFGSDVNMDNFTLYTRGNNPAIFGYFNSVTFGETFRTDKVEGAYDIHFIAGYNVYYDKSLIDISKKNTYDTLESVSSSKDVVINIQGGTFSGILLGNRRIADMGPVGVYSGNMIVNLTGGVLVDKHNTNIPSGALTMMNLTGSIVVNFNGMDVQGTFYGVTRTATLIGVTYDSTLNTGSVVINAPANVMDHIVENQNFSVAQTATIEKLTMTCTTAVGDIDIDGEISNADITAIVRYLAGWDVPGAKFTADYNADEKINNRDAIALIQKIAGWAE